MGMLKDYELTASLLAGGLSGTRWRLLRTIRRLMVCRRGDAHDDPDHFQPDCRSPSWSAAISQALSDLNDVWQGRAPRPARFRALQDGLFLPTERYMRISVFQRSTLNREAQTCMISARIFITDP